MPMSLLNMPEMLLNPLFKTSKMFTPYLFLFYGKMGFILDPPSQYHKRIPNHCINVNGNLAYGIMPKANLSP